jgi:predicted phage-related endonuclease
MQTHTQLEQAISDYDYLNKQIKALEKEKEAIKDNLVKSYFADQDEYFDINGCLLATYKEYAREGLNGKLIKVEQPVIYQQYLTITAYKRFEVK